MSLPYLILLTIPGIIGMVFSCLLLWQDLHLKNKTRALARMTEGALADLDAPRFAGSLVDILESHRYAGDSLPATLLTRLLPRLTPADISVMDDRQRAYLYRALSLSTGHGFFRRDNLDFALASLQAIRQIGDARGIPCVERIANSAAKTSVQERVREEAQLCLVSLRERAEGQNSSQSLVRPASAPDTPGRELLRPAESSEERNPEQLLRPGSHKE